MDEKKNGGKHHDVNRRDFIKMGAAAGLGAAVAGIALQGCDQASKTRSLSTTPRIMKADPINPVKIGFVGVGSRGFNHVRNILRLDGIEIKAFCDIVPEKVERAQQFITDAGLPKPTAYTQGERDFVRMCETEDLDLVIHATPWKWHVPGCVASMQNGKHTAVEVPAALTIDECWELVENAEKYNKHCVMLENCNYGRAELMNLNMVRQGVYGELIHGEGGYCHDLRNMKLGGGEVEKWRVEYSIKNNGNLYPTHGLGPIANCMNINRGDRFDFLVSMSGISRGLHDYAVEKLGPDSKFANTKFALGDINVSLIKTANGLTITLYHDTDLARPYSRINMVQGVKAISIGYPDRIYIEGRSPFDRWEPLETYSAEYEHPLWRKIGELARGSGHGGMDFILDYRLIQCLKTGTPTDMDVYDAAALSAIIEMSQISVANKCQAVDFPDFTRGMWENREPLGIVEA